MMTATLDRLRALHLGAMADAYRTQQQDPAIVGAQLRRTLQHARRCRAPFSRQSRARAPAQGGQTADAECVSRDLDYAPRRGLDRALIRQLATGRWIAEHHNVLITGATGVGKTYLGCALGQHACRQGYRAIFGGLPRLFQELALAHADGSYTTLLARFARVDVLVLDDWGLAAVKDGHRQDLLEMLDDRDGSRSTIITSQLPRERWHDYWGTRRSPTRSSIAWCTARIRSRSKARLDERTRAAGEAAARMETGRGRRQTHGRADAPTGLWKTARTRFPTPPTAITQVKGEGRTPNRNLTVNSVTTIWRVNTGNLFRSSASLRSDHDAVVPVITMAWTD